MAESSYPVANGGAVTEWQYEKLMGQALGEGRYDNESTAFSTSAIAFGDGTGRVVKLRAGAAAMVRGFRWESGTDPVIIPLDANTTGQPRLDLIVLRLDRQSYTVRSAVIKGQAAVNPVAPAPVRQIGETGFFDTPIAAARVVSSSVTGQPQLGAGDVIPLEVRTAPQPRIGLASAMRSTGSPPGTVWSEFDTGMVWANSGSGSVLLGEKGDRIKVGVAVGWNSDDLYVQRRNGWTSFSGSATWADTIARQPSTVTNVCTLPDDFRPAFDVNSICMVSPTQLARFYITASTGVVQLRQFAQVLPSGGGIVIPPTTYPSKGV